MNYWVDFLSGGCLCVRIEIHMNFTETLNYMHIQRPRSEIRFYRSIICNEHDQFKTSTRLALQLEPMRLCYMALQNAHAVIAKALS
jgi:hypothetical protein